MSPVNFCLMALLLGLAWVSRISARPLARDNSTLPDRLVFAHFMAGFVSEYAESDWLSDITLAHSFGLDGFALNVDESAAIPTQLSNAFSAAESFNSGLTDGTQFVLFVSFDFLHYSTSDPQSVADALTPILDSSAYLVVDGKKMVSSFEGDGMDWSSVSSAAGQDLYPVPYYSSGASNAGDANVDGLFSWYTWPGQDTNDVVYQNMTTDVDEGYITSLEAAGKYYMAPVSPWFYAHLPASTGYPKNNYLYSDVLWPTRWAQILSMASASQNLRWVEVITWNDWTESSLISPFKGAEMSDGNYLWSEDFPHTSMGKMMAPYIAAFKSGGTTPTITQDQLVYWYRPTLKDVECDSTDTVGTKPTGWDMAADSIFVTALTTTSGTVTLTTYSGTSSQDVEAGVNVLAFPMVAGQQTVTLTTSDGRTGSSTGAIEVLGDSCYNGVYNFNIYSGDLTLDGSGSSSSSSGSSSGSTSGIASSTLPSVTASSPADASSGVPTSSDTSSGVSVSASSDVSASAAASDVDAQASEPVVSSVGTALSVVPSSAIPASYAASATGQASPASSSFSVDSLSACLSQCLAA